MAITRTAKGTAQDKTSTTTLTISSVSMTANELLVVCVGFETDSTISSVTWGGRNLKSVSGSLATQGDTRCRMFRAKVSNTDTRDVVITWAAAVTAKAAVAVAVNDEAVATDIVTAQGQASTTAGDTASAGTSTVANTVSLAFFVTGGPSTDSAGTAGSGHTLGQRVGTSGDAAGTNVTIQETYEILTATGTIQSTLTLSTARIMANCIADFRASEENRWGVVPTDLQKVRAIFDEKVTPIEHTHMLFYFNEEEDRIEVYDRGGDVDDDTLIAHLDVDGATEWVEI